MYAAASPARTPTGLASPTRTATPQTSTRRTTASRTTTPIRKARLEQPARQTLQPKPPTRLPAHPAQASARAPAVTENNSRLVQIQAENKAPRIQKPSSPLDLGVRGKPSIPPRSSPPPVATGSVSDVIKRLSGRGYDVYRDIFLAKARPAIRETLLRQPNRPASLFGEELNEAENLIHEFLERNYANPYMDWKTSDQHTQLEVTGYELENIEEVIEACYKRLK